MKIDFHHKATDIFIGLSHKVLNISKSKIFFVYFTTMDSVTLLHPKETFTIPALQAMTKCKIFQNDSTLFGSPYQVQSSVSLSVFREFISALEGNAINITDTNFTELQRLCEEFGFSEIAAKFSEFRPLMDFKEAEDADARGRIAALEEKANQHSHIIAILQDKVTQLSTDFGRLVGEVSALRSPAAGIQTLSEEVSALKAQIAQKLDDPVAKQLSTKFSELQNDVLILKVQIAAMTPNVTPSPNQPSSPSLRVPTVDSRIISDLRRSSQSSEGRNFHFCGRAAPMVWKHKNFTADVAVTGTP
jgi:hypothetical protein